MNYKNSRGINIQTGIALILTLVLISCGLFEEDTGITDTFYFSSTSIDDYSTVLVYYPEDYASDTPVIYLLNGWDADIYAWGSGIDLAREAFNRNIIFVSISAGANRYTNDTANPDKDYDAYVLEVVEKVETEYNIEIEYTQRAICGMSNGGGGALYLLSEHPRTFVAGGSLSGSHYTEMSKYNNLKNLGIIIDVGTEDYAVLAQLRRLHTKLNDERVSHTYSEHKGGHNWDFWQKYGPKQFDFLEDKITNGQSN